MFRFRWLKDNFNEFIFVAVVLVVFLCSSLFYISLPGLGHDEATNSLLALQKLVSSDVSLYRLVSNFGFHDFMADQLQSSVLIWLYTFVFYFFGINVFIIRFVSVFFSLFFLLFFYFFVRTFFNKRFAMFALVLTSTLPSLIFYIRVNIDFHFLLIPVFGCLLFFARFYKGRRLSDLCVGCLFFGLGFSYNIMFWWFSFAFVVAFLLSRFGVHFKRKELIVGFLFFLLGASPIIIWNITTPFEEGIAYYALEHSHLLIALFKDSPTDKSDNFVYDPTLSIGYKTKLRFIHLYKTLSGDLYEWKGLHLFMKLHNFLNWGFFLAALIFSLITILPGIMKKKQKEILFILIIMFITLLEIIFFGTYATYQMLILVPFCMILSANLFNYLLQHLKIFSYILFGIILMVNLLILGRVYSNFISGNMCSGFFPEDNLPSFPSKNIYDLARYLQEHKIYHPVIIDDTGALNLGPNLDVLTFLKIKPISFSSDAEFIDTFKKESTFRDSMFLTSNLKDFYKTVNLTKDILRNSDKIMAVNKTFYLGDGGIEYLLFQVI